MHESGNFHSRQHKNKLFAPATALALTIGLTACGAGGDGLSQNHDDKPGIVLDSPGSKHGPWAYEPGLSDLGAGSIDEQSPLYEEHEAPGGKTSYVPLATVRPDEGSMRIFDSSPDGMDDRTLEWLGDRVMTNEALVRTAFDAGSIDSIVFALAKDQTNQRYNPVETGYVVGYFSEKENKVVFEISSHNAGLTAEVMNQYVTHEVLHSLFADTSISTMSSEKIPADTRDAFNNACQVLRSEALNDFGYARYSIARDLYEAADASPDKDFGARLRALADQYNWGEMESGQPTIENHSEADDPRNIPGCQIYVTPGPQAMLVGDNLGLPTPGNIDLFSGEYDDTLRALNRVHEDFSSTLRKDTLYAALAEGMYLEDAPDMGHPQDGADELAASLFNLIINFSDDFTRKVRLLPRDQQLAIVEVATLFYEELREAHPEAEEVLGAPYNKFLDSF